MSHDHPSSIEQIRPWSLPRWAQFLIVLVLLGGMAGAAYWYERVRASHAAAAAAAVNPKPARPEPARGTLVLTPVQLATVTVEPVQPRAFHDEIATEGKIVVDDDRTTPIFSPYSGRVISLFAKPGQQIKAGQPLFSLQATEMVQAQNDLLAAISGVNKSRSQLGLAQIVERRQAELYQGKAIALKEWQTAQNELTAAQNDLKIAEVSLEAARNRLRILGKTDQEIATFQQKGVLNPETVINAPIGGTIIQRKIGPGQYVSSGSGDPAFTIGDLSRIWLIANVREADVSRLAIGQRIEFKVLALPDRTFAGPVTYISSTVDPGTRRILVRAEIDNRQDLLKPEMFASVRLTSGADRQRPSVPKDAVIYEGDGARVWVMHDDNSVQIRQIKAGIVNGDYLEVLDGLRVGEKVVTRGSLFIDRVANGEG